MALLKWLCLIIRNVFSILPLVNQFVIILSPSIRLRSWFWATLYLLQVWVHNTFERVTEAGKLNGINEVFTQDSFSRGILATLLTKNAGPNTTSCKSRKTQTLVCVKPLTALERGVTDHISFRGTSASGLPRRNLIWSSFPEDPLKPALVVSKWAGLWL